MSRINTNVNSLIAQRVLGQNNSALTKSLERLSTGYRINRGGDDPAGLIASEKLRSEQRSLTTAISNAERADQVVNIIEGGLQEISNLLLEVQSLVGQNGSEGGLSTSEKEANQLQVDQIVQSIDRIAGTTSFNGTKLLNGRQDFVVDNVNAHISDFTVFGAKLPRGSSVAVETLITQSAQHGGFFLNLTAAVVNTGGDSSTERFTFELAGANGTREFTFASGTAIASVTTAINQFTEVTGVSAVTSGNFVELKSDEFGSDAFVTVEVKNSPAGLVGTLDTQNATNEALAVAGTAFNALTEAEKDTGANVGAIINGVTARGNGLIASVSRDALDLSITLDADDTVAGAHAQELGSFTALEVESGGATFNLGPEVNIGNQVRLGVANIAARNLGSQTLGFVDELGAGQTFNIITGNLDTAQKIVTAAIDEVSNLRGRIGAFQANVVQSSLRSLAISLENTQAAESAIRDTDFAAETARLTRNQILVQAASSALGIANAQPQSVLGLL